MHFQIEVCCSSFMCFFVDRWRGAPCCQLTALRRTHHMQGRAPSQHTSEWRTHSRCLHLVAFNWTCIATLISKHATDLDKLPTSLSRHIKIPSSGNIFDGLDLKGLDHCSVWKLQALFNQSGCVLGMHPCLCLHYYKWTDVIQSFLP